MDKSNANIFLIYLHYQYYFTIHFKISLNSYIKLKNEHYYYDIYII